jgi:bla regulator protein BlaR1
VTLDNLAAMLNIATRPLQVANKTGLSGSYEIAMDFDPTPVQSGPVVAPPAAGDKPSVFTAVQEQLGLKLVPSRTKRSTLVVDRIEPPSEN